MVPVSIIMPVYNQLDYTRECVDFIRRYTDIDYQLIIINNGSRKETGDFLAGLKCQGTLKNLEVLANTRNMGVAMAWNQGLYAAKGYYLLVLNNDVLVSPGWLIPVLELLDDSGVGLASPQLADGESVRGHWPETADKMVKNKAEPGFYGCAFGLTRRTLCRVGYFDQRFRWGSWEDADYGVRCVQNGLQLQITNQSVVYHYGGKTQTGVTEKVGSYYHDNMYRFGKKWGLNMNRPFVFNRGILEFLD